MYSSYSFKERSLKRLPHLSRHFLIVLVCVAVGGDPPKVLFSLFVIYAFVGLCGFALALA